MSIFRGVRIVAVILCTTGIALLAYMDGVDPKEGVSIGAEESKNIIYKGLPTFTEPPGVLAFQFEIPKGLKKIHLYSYRRYRFFLKCFCIFSTHDGVT